jgi:DNA-directed RNA polymerase specialized sigma24 family protein
MKKKKYKINPSTPRLSDEELDPLEKDDNEGVSVELLEGHLPWTTEDVADIKKLINIMLPEKQQEILTAFLEGLTHQDIGVSEKYWRYHFAKGVDFIKQELKL